MSKTPLKLKPKQAVSNPKATPDPNVKIENPSYLDFPVFAMIFPHRWDTDDPNNVWMKGLSTEEINDRAKCYKQWMKLYGWLTREGCLVQTIPAVATLPMPSTSPTSASCSAT